jgi:nitroreductase
MSGIIFFKTKSLEEMHKFYHDKLKLKFWLKQKGCNIYQSGNFLIGFIEAFEADTQGIIDFFEPNKQLIDKKYEGLKDITFVHPQINELYNIYNFSVKDPEGRVINFQTFLHNVPMHKTSEEALVYRRSIRKFKNEPVPKEILDEVFSLCRYSPTSNDSQSFYFIVVQNKEDLEFLSKSRGDSSSFLSSAPTGVIVVADQTKTLRPIQDSNIAATYLVLAAYSLELGTCWIAEMNTSDIKDRFGIPQNDHIACVIATGYPDEEKDIPNKRNITDFVTYR